MARKSQLILGVNIGGTKVAGGLVNGEGEIVFQTRTPMIIHLRVTLCARKN